VCGIAGMVAADDGSPDSNALAEALTAIRHRGPDDDGLWIDGRAAIGMRRLAVIDVQGGHQPVFNEDGSVGVVFNGEIYNYRELLADLRSRGHVIRSDSDTESLVHLYEEHGADMCRRLRGMFAFAIWDRRAGRLLLGRDRFGKKPLYLARGPRGELLFASELKALRPLMAAVGMPAEIDDQAVYDYLSLGCVPQPRTIYRGVTTLEPGGWLTFAEASLRTGHYWRLDALGADDQPPYREAIERTRELLGEAVRVRLRSDVPLGVFLSGGLDSSVVAYEAAKVVGGGLRTFTVAMPDRQLDESPVAVRTAAALGVRNDVLTLDVVPDRELLQLVRHFDQPFADSSAIPSLAISRMAREHVTVILNGDGGDEVFAGYRRYVAAVQGQRWQHVPRGLVRLASGSLARLPVGRRSAGGFLARFLRGLPLPDGARYLAWTTDLLDEQRKREIWQAGDVEPTEDWLAGVVAGQHSWMRWQMLADARVNLLSDLLIKMDMATMAASLEGRSPLLDQEVVAFTARLPDHYLVRGSRTKCLLRDAYREVLPDEVIRGGKRGFEIPLARWLGHELSPLVHDMLGSPAARVRTWIDGRWLDGLLASSAGLNLNRPALVYALLVLEMWLRDHEG
jgi:asparagine synthase (glutamine-hydrolysing)